MDKANIKVIIPRIPNADLVKPDVLVMEYCDGFSVRNVHEFDKHGVDRNILLERVCNSFAVQMHHDGLFNADPHPGKRRLLSGFHSLADREYLDLNGPKAEWG